MSESCGSNGYPNAEGEKQKPNKRRTRQEVEEDPDEAVSTTQHSVTTCQQPYRMSFFIKRKKDVSGSSKRQDPPLDSQPIGGTQILYSDSQPVLETQYTQQLYERETAPDFQPVLETQYTEEQDERSPDDQFRDVTPESIPYIGIEDPYRLKQVQSPFEGRNVHATAEDNGPQVVDPDSKRFIDTYANDDNLNRPIVENIVRAARRKSDKINQRECTIMEGSYLAKKIMKYSKVKVDGKEVMNVMNLLQIKFKEYCRIMSQGVAGLEFDFDSGAIKLAEKGDQDDSMMRHMSTMHKHAILYFVSLKVIFRGTWEKYKESFLRRQKSNSSRRLYSKGGSSSSGKRMSTSDTSKSIRKPPKLSVSSIFTAYEERPPHLASLTRRLQTIFSENKFARMDVINKLLMFFSENPFLFNLFMSYDDEEFREKIILLKKTNLDKS